MTPTTIALVSFAVALCLGWMLSKAYFRTYGANKYVSGKKYEDMRKRYRKRLLIMHKLVLRHESTQKQIKQMLKEIQKSRQARGASDDVSESANDTQGELSVLLNQIAERDREIADLQAQIDPTEPRTDAENVEASHEAFEQSSDLQSELSELKTELSKREHQVRELHLNLAESETNCLALKAKLDSWKHRVSPLTEKLKQQRKTIRELSTDIVEQS